jgi:Peptidase family M28
MTKRFGSMSFYGILLAAICLTFGCQNGAGKTNADDGNAPVSAVASVVQSDAAPAPQETGGFDGHQAYVYTEKLVSFGPRPPGSPAIKKMQDYVYSQVKADGCQVDEDYFHASTPIGSLPMRNIIAKSQSKAKDVILLLTHYDTLDIPNFVGAEDGGSSSGLMLEMARHTCTQTGPMAIWIAFLDGEEALVNWNKDNDNTYGSRELAAKLQLSGQLKNIKAVILADMVGQKGLRLQRESNSTPWLADFVWSTAAKLGYRGIFVSGSAGPIEDDHLPFVSKGVPSVDIIDLNDYINEGYWHTPQDTMDKISPKSLAVVGHVILSSVEGLEKKFSSAAPSPSPTN